jgi:hypothetical protein
MQVLMDETSMEGKEMKECSHSFLHSPHYSKWGVILKE